MGTTFLSDLMQYQRLLQMLLVLGMGGTLLVGFQVSVIASPSQDIKRFINETWFERHGTSLRHETLTLLWSTIVSIYCVGGLLGGLCSGPLVTRYGKKKAFLCNDVLVIAAALLIGFSEAAGSFEMILLGRFLYGFSAGISLNIHGPYLGEVSPKKLRGFVATTASVFLSLGKALGQIMALRALLGSRWPLLLALCGVAALLQLLLLPLFPESPPYLLIQKGDQEGCLKAMKELWGEGPHHAEMEDLLREKAAAQTAKNLGILEVMKAPALRKPLWVTILLILSLQLSGLIAVETATLPYGEDLWSLPCASPRSNGAVLKNKRNSEECLTSSSNGWSPNGIHQKAATPFSELLAKGGLIYFYTVEVFRTAKLEEALIPYVALGLGTSEFVSVVLCSSIIDRFGRKILLWGGFGLMAVVMALLIVTLSLQDRFPWMSYGSISLIFLFVVFYGLGPSGAIFALILEMFNQSARASVFIIAGTISWVGLFLNGMFFPFVVEALGHFCFLIFLAVLIGAAVFVYTVLPETKGKSITDITEEFSRIRLGRKRTQEENFPWKGQSPCTKL